MLPLASRGVGEVCFEKAHLRRCESNRRGRSYRQCCTAQEHLKHTDNPRLVWQTSASQRGQHVCCRKSSKEVAKRQSFQVQQTHKIQTFLPQLRTISIALSTVPHRYMNRHVPQPCMWAEGTDGRRGRTCAGELRAHGVARGAVVAQQREGRPQRHCAAQLRVAWLQHPAQRQHPPLRLQVTKLML